MKIQQNAPNLGANDRFVDKNTTEGSEVQGTKVVANFPNQIIEDIQVGYIGAAGLEPSATDTTQVKQATDIFIDRKLDPVKEDIVNTKAEMTTELASTKAEIENDLEDTKVEIEAMLEKYGGTHPIYTVRIDEKNADPEQRVSYHDKLEGLTQEEIDVILDDILGMEICLFQNRQVNYYVNRYDHTKKLDGTSADITSGADGDVMVEFKRCYTKWWHEGDYLYISISKSKYEGFSDEAFMYCDSVREKFYHGVYAGCVIDGKLRSLSGKTPTVSQAITTFRSYARANGDGYEQVAYNKITLLQVLFLVRFKSTNSQTALGIGWTAGSALTTTGATNDKGLYYGSENNEQIKCFGMEDFYGNIRYFVEGISTSNGNVYISNGGFNDFTGDICRVVTSSFAGLYPSKVSGTDKLGFLITEAEGTTDTHYCDYQYLNSSSAYVASFGGHWGYGSDAGAFSLSVGASVSGVYSYVGARLAFYGV